MFKSSALSILVLAPVLLVGGLVQAQTSRVEFSADTVQKGPQGIMSTGKMYVGKDKMRMEMSQGGHNIVNITDSSRMVSWTLLPGQRTYMEQKDSAGVAKEAAPGNGGNPCDGIPGAVCRSLGTEKVAGRNTQKWEVKITQQGQTYTSTQWIDNERGMPLKQEMPGGQRSELFFLGMEKLGERTVEKWEMISSHGNQAPSRSLQWYDPQLDLAVRQEMPGGYVSELKNIRLGSQPDELFQVPADYKRVSMPMGGLPGGR